MVVVTAKSVSLTLVVELMGGFRVSDNRREKESEKELDICTACK